MRLPSTIAALAACLTTAHAFSDTSPFLLFSSSPFPANLPYEQLLPSSQVLDTARQILRECSSSVYYIVSQPGISSTELKANSPHLKNAVRGKNVKGRWIISETMGLGSGSVDELVGFLRGECDAQDAEMGGGDGDARVRYVVLNGKAGDGVAHADLTLHNKILSSLPETPSYTVIYTTTPSTSKHEEMLYEAAFEEPLHMDLKRQLMVRYPTNTTTNDTRPLFEKYQFFTPGIFMGILVSFVMLGLLAVGLSAISSLQVSYGAFEKEMGPSAQKKA